MSRLISGVVAFCAACFLALVQLAPAIELTIGLDPSVDQYGQQIYTVQQYSYGATSITDFGIYDTGASVITFGAVNRDAFPPTAIKNVGGAGGEGIGGSVVGDVSQPGAVTIDGIQAFDLGSFNFETLEFNINLNQQVAVPNIQTFVGTTTGSADLPTLTGTPIHKPSAAFVNGSAAKVSMQGYQLDFGDLDGSGNNLVWAMPKLELVAAGTPLAAKAGSTAPARIALTPYGEDNYGSEGNSITSGTNPTFNSVTLKNAATTLSGQKLLFDTGAQVTIISTATATALGLNLSAPDTVVNVQGASGTPISLPGFSISGLELAAAIEGATPTDLLKFSNVPIFVYDLGIPGLDGILGMNVFNTADEMLIDPVTGQLSVSFYEISPIEPSDGSDLMAALLQSQYSAFAGHIAPAVGLGQVTEPVPEPAAGVLLLIALVAAWAWRRR